MSKHTDHILALKEGRVATSLEGRSVEFFTPIPIPSPPFLSHDRQVSMKVGLVTVLQLLCEQFMPLQLPSQSFVCCTWRKGKN